MASLLSALVLAGVIAWASRPRTTAADPATTRVDPPLSLSVGALQARPVRVHGAPVEASPLDGIWSIVVEAPGLAWGAVVVVGEDGQSLAAPAVLERIPPTSGRLRALVPRRDLTPFAGRASAIVILADAGGARYGRVELPGDLDPASGSTIEDAARLADSGEPDRALALADRLRAAASEPDAPLVDAVAAEAAFSLGRGLLARRLAERGLATPGALSPALRARLLRTSVRAQAEGNDSPPSVPDREALRETEAERLDDGERILDAALDLRLALVHDRFWSPPEVPEAARRLRATVAGADDDDDVAGAAAMVCEAARQLARDSPGEADRLMGRATRAARARGTVAARAYCAFAAGDGERAAGRLDGARSHYAEARRLLGDRALPREQREAWFSSAQLSARSGQYAEALSQARAAYAWVDFSLSLEADLSEREDLLVNTLGYYGAAERFAVLAGDLDGAVVDAEWGKARAFAALFAASADVEEGASGSLVVDRAGSPGADAAIAPGREALEALRRSLRPGDVALSYTLLGTYDGKNTMAIGVVTPARAAARLVAYPDDMRDTVRALGDAVQANDTDGARSAGRRLYAALVEPVASDLEGARRVFVSPHLYLHAVPWAALHDGTRFLVERFAFARVPPLIAARRTADDDRPVVGPGAGGAWLVAHDARHPGSTPLPEAAALAAEVTATGPARVELAGEQLTPEAFLDAATRVDAILFAGHARYDAAAPLHSALLLGPSPVTGADRVEARAVLGLGHRLDVALLVGCETSRLWSGRSSYSDEAMGLQRAFLAGGARHVVGALWPVLDRDAEDFVRALFGQDAARDAVSAVAAAQRCMAAGECRARGIASWASFSVDAR
jgi:CHAT domain-containing protein